MSLAPNKESSLLFLPDYHLSVPQVQNELAKKSITTYNSLNVLRYVERTSGKDLLPTWASRWTFGSTATRIQACHDTGEPIAWDHMLIEEKLNQGSIDFYYHAGHDRKVLHVKGRLLLEVGIFSMQTHAIYKSPDLHLPRISLAEDDAAAFKEYQNRRWRPSEYLLAGKVFDDSFLDVAPTVREDEGSDLHDSINHRDSIPWRQAVLPSLDFILRGRHMAAVHRPYHAIVPNATRSGDLVVALHGIRVLFVLRPQRGHIDGSAW